MTDAVAELLEAGAGVLARDRVMPGVSRRALLRFESGQARSVIYSGSPANTRSMDLWIPAAGKRLPFHVSLYHSQLSSLTSFGQGLPWPVSRSDLRLKRKTAHLVLQ